MPVMDHNNFNLNPFVIPPSIDGWEINSQTDREVVVNYSGSKRLNPINKVTQTFSTVNGSVYNLNLHALIYNSSGGNF